MDKEKIISAVSIDIGLSKEKSEKVVNAVFDSVMKALKKEGELAIQKFGRFKIYSESDNDKSGRIKFIPAKKLSLRVNSDFRNLKKVKIKKDQKTAEEEFRKYDVIISGTENENDENFRTPGWVNNNNSGSGKILISDDLINLHKEITKDIKKTP